MEMSCVSPKQSAAWRSTERSPIVGHRTIGSHATCRRRSIRVRHSYAERAMRLIFETMAIDRIINSRSRQSNRSWPIRGSAR